MESRFVSSTANESSRRLYEARQAATTTAAFFDVSDRTQFEITGADRAQFLHSFTSNDIKGLKAGQGCETFITNLKGKVVAHVYAFSGPESIWLDGTPGQAETIFNHLRKYVLIEDVQLKPNGSERGEIYVTGPLAAQLLQLEDTLPLHGHLRREADGRSMEIRRVDMFGTPGFLISADAPQLDVIKRGLLMVGVPEGPPELFEALRIEAGYPQFGKDISDDNLAQEVARTKRCVSFTKGCYLGQETIARLDAMGHTNRELRRLKFDSSLVLQPGTLIFDAAGQTEVGVVTSASAEIGLSPTNEGTSVYAMGILKRAACAPDTALVVKQENQEVTGKVLPFPV